MIANLPFAFAQPLMLIGLVSLPVLWWLLRLMPPRPRRIDFPPTRLLFDIAPDFSRYGVFYARQKVETAGGGYVVDHTSDTYVIAADGQLVGKIAHATPPDQVAAEIRKRLTQP